MEQQQQQQQPPSPGQIRCSREFGCRQHRERVLALDFGQVRLMPVPRSPALLLHLSFPSASTPRAPVDPSSHPRGAQLVLFGSGAPHRRCAGLCSTRCSPVQPLQPHQSIWGEERLYRQCKHRISLLRANFWQKASPSLSPT